MVNFRVQSGKFTPGRKIYTDGVTRVTDNYQVCEYWHNHPKLSVALPLVHLLVFPLAGGNQKFTNLAGRPNLHKQEIQNTKYKKQKCKIQNIAQYV